MATSGALAACVTAGVSPLSFIARHARLDPGDLSPADIRANNASVSEQPAVVFLTNGLPNPLIDALTLARWQVFEALAMSEVLHLCEHQNIRAVVIAVGYSHPASQGIRQQHMTL